MGVWGAWAGQRQEGAWGCGVGLMLLPEPIKDNSSTLQADDMVGWEDTLKACSLQDRDRPKMKPLGSVLQLNCLSCVSNKTSFCTVPPSTGPALFVNRLNSLGE